ncbi:biotin carboxyl carrier domain-containing protein [Gordonia sp. TBRC 11910]|uniref:Biotin carboxyl carrier protein of acetyl-CoA carboxylase n=1 Tax=Gordonia asplenii TaxID=2725283 RepID=A0A848L0X4_9ACTN|nr:acetyl-CoA carboxylase [Gordonia asplenii]NMO04107.1 biotin carboxyl carrier domain-containing protein [Gordonia asplenii]
MAQHQIASPLPGVFYRSPAPGEPPFVQVGATVTADQTVGLVEIMKQFTDVKAGADGVLAEFAVDDNAMLSPGDVVAIIETD